MFDAYPTGWRLALLLAIVVALVLAILFLSSAPKSEHAAAPKTGPTAIVSTQATGYCPLGTICE